MTNSKPRSAKPKRKPDNFEQPWNASLPYPVWPFGTVNPRELQKWMKKNPEPVEEAPF